MEKTTIRTYRDLVAWQKAMDLVEVIYTTTRDWPRDEIYGLTSQIRRAAVSIPSNIAEGQGRTSTKEFLHHLSVARGSLREVETQALIAGRLHYAQPEVLEHLLCACTDTSKVINGLISTLANRTHDE